MVRLNFFTSIAQVASIAVIASAFFVVVFLPQPFLRCRLTFVVIALHLAIASTIAVSAFWLVVALVAPVASQSTVGIMTPIIAASAIQPACIVSPALVLALACLAMSMIRAARLTLLANVIFEHPLGAVPDPLDLKTFEHAVVFALSKKRLEIRQQSFNHLINLTYLC
jgi:hypothetical protein